MKPKTMILMVVAIGCGLGASYMTSRLLAERSAKPTDVPTVPVLVAKVRVPGWQAIKEPEKFFEIKDFPEDVAPKRALGSFSELKDQRLKKPIDEGKPVSQDDLLTKEQEEVGHKLLPGQRAVAIKVTTESIVGGFVLPGSRVDIILTTKGNDPTSRIVLQNMLVLAADTQDNRNPDQRVIIAQTVTVAATVEEAARLTLASSVGELRLALKGNGDTKRIGPVVARASDLDKPLSREGSEKADQDVAPASPTPPLPVLPADDKAPQVEQAKAPIVEKPRKRHVMTIINGLEKRKEHFHDEDDDDVTTSSAAASKPGGDPDNKGEGKGEKKDAKPDVNKEAAKAADKSSPKRIQ